MASAPLGTGGPAHRVDGGGGQGGAGRDGPRALRRLPAAPVPYPVALALLGIAVGLIPGLPKQAVGGGLILLLFVPPLVFEAGVGLDLAALRRALLPVSLLATVGVLLTVGLIGAAAHFGLGWGWGSALVLGAILSPTDPIAVVTLVRRLGAPRPLAVLLEGESLFNDGTGVAVFAAIIAALGGGAPTASGVLVHLALLVAGGAAVGAVIGAVATLALRRWPQAGAQVAITLATAYASYLLADRLGFAGVVAVVAAAIAVARVPRPEGRFWAGLGFLLNAVLFFIVGEELPGSDLLGVAGPILVTYAALFIGRALPVYLLLAVADPGLRRLPWRWRHLTFWGGLRGALSIALALSVVNVPQVDRRVSTIAYGAVVLSLLLQGGLLELVFRGLGLSQAVEATDPEESGAR